MMNSMAKKLLAIFATVTLLAGVAYGMTINGQLVKAMFENLSSDPTGHLGRVYYNTTSNTVKIYNGSSWVEIGSSSSGGGASNLIENGNAETASVPAAWTTFDDGAVSVPVDGTGGSPSAITAIARTTTAGELIDQTGSFKLVKSAANAQGEGWAYDFSFKAKSQLYSQLVTLNFDFYSSSASSDSIVVYLYDKDAAALITPVFVTCGGASTATLTSQTTTCHVQMAWFSTTSDDYRLIFMVSTTGVSAHNYFVDNLYTGQHTAAVGAAVGKTESLSITVKNGATTYANGTSSAFYKRVGDTMLGWGSFVATGAASGSGSFRLVFPSNLTINTSHVTSQGHVGSGYLRDDSSAQNRGTIALAVLDTDELIIQTNGEPGEVSGGLLTDTAPFTWTTDDAIGYSFAVSINEWAGSQANFGENNIEWVYNTSTTDADDTTSFGVGQTGGQFPSVTTSAKKKRVRFSSPIVDAPWIEIFSDGQWRRLSGAFQTIREYDTQNSVTYGMQLIPVSGSTTDADIVFGQYRLSTAATFGGVGTDYSAIDADNSFKWRAVKARPGVPVGFGFARDGNSGLLEYFRSENLGALTVAGGTDTASGGSASTWISRSGDVVTARVTLVTGSSVSDATITVAASSIPSWAAPIVNTYSMQPVNFTNGEYAFLVFGSNGSMSFFLRDVDDGSTNAWPASTTVGTWNYSWTLH